MTAWASVDATVLIPTYNRAEVLARLLASLRAARPVPAFAWDAVVVDNNSTHDTKAVVAHFQEGGLPGLRYVFEGRAGKSRALNSGLDHIAAEFVAFLDDDVVVDEGYLAGLAHVIRTYPYRVFGGRVLPVWSSPSPHWVTGGRPLLTSRGGIIAHDYGDAARPYDRTMRMPIGCNFVCRRRLFDEVGLFDIRLGPRPGVPITGEETNLLRRLERHGERILYVPEVTVRHPVDPQRVTRSYARYRLFCEGRTVARASLGEGRVPTVFGVPRHLYRRLVESAGRAAFAACRGDSYRAFDQELDVCYVLGSIYEYRRIARRGLDD